MATARDELLGEIKRLGGRLPIISTNIPLRRDGIPYASGKAPDDAGVAVYFTYKDAQHCFACDKWTAVNDNVQAIRKTIEALRGISRWGTGDMMERAFTGFAALPDPESAGGEHWSTVLGVPSDASDDEVRAAYRRARSAAHTDRDTGDNAAFHRVQTAWELARQERDL
ncbi:heat shock protein DnaJ domain-containing protein [Salinisphaera hydrothermalis C41B8]|uniref:Heat shock protein DnaJ domain-containing protein n=2 Tax=Salinisphaera TaxID=180541 RepID=A0A084INS5_SALHC|nr:heat shock protein DnaJ domain-containing protein [Salinisphaera hydrothermalis C41B8]